MAPSSEMHKRAWKNVIYLLFLFLCARFLWTGHDLGGWRCRLNLSMFLLTISVCGIWSVQSDLEFSAIKKNLRIMSDIERVFWTVLLRMASRVFFLYPERLQSRKELVCVYRASYFCCEIGLRGFPAALFPVAEMVYEA